MSDNTKALAGALGGTARIRLHGNPGTHEGRRRGGLKSQATHKKLNSRFKVLRKAITPRKSRRLAELIGILAGDGHVGMYQVSVTTNANTDQEHAVFVRSLLEETFGLPVTLKRRKNSNVLIVLLSSKGACDILRTVGIPSGNKTRDQITPPEWIVRSAVFRRSFLRGLIDTDGSVYFDRHTIKGKEYASLCIAFTNASIPLLHFVEQTWKELGYNPTRFGRNVRLRRKKEVLGYASTIGFSNPKHAQKIRV